MSQAQNPQVDLRMIEQTRKHINRLREEVARLSEADITPAEYFNEFLPRVLAALAAPAGAVWVRTPAGNFQLQCQVRMQQVGLDKSDAAREAHGELLRQAAQQGKPLSLPPHFSEGDGENARTVAGNPTDYLLLLVPITMNNQVAGLIEVWQDPNRHPSAVQGFLQFLVHMAELASRYMRNRLLGEMIGQQELWTKMEQFARQIHESLHPVEVAYRVANEGRRLIDCDRVSVGVRYGKRMIVEAVSGADTVEKRSNLIRRMRKLFERVQKWGEKLVYTGTKDDTLPPDVLKALDAYLEESNTKMLCILPLHDEREIDEDDQTKIKKPARSVLMMECFETSAGHDQLIARQEVIGRHAVSALYNAVEHRRIPMRFLWLPLARLQEGLGGKTRAIIYSVAAALLVLIGVLYFVPYPLKMDATGNLMPEHRRVLYSPTKGHIVQFNVEPGQQVSEDENLVLMRDFDLFKNLVELEAQIASSERRIKALNSQLSRHLNQQEIGQVQAEIEKERIIRDAKWQHRELLLRSIKSDPGRPGYFWLLSPKPPIEAARSAGARWTVLNWDYKEKFTDAEVKPSDPLLRLGYLQGPWEVLLKIPHKHIGQVLQAIDRLDAAKRERVNELLEKAIVSEWLAPDVAKEWSDQEHVRQMGFSDLRDQLRALRVFDKALEAGWMSQTEYEELMRDSELDVDLLVKSAPTQTYKGKLTRNRIASAADSDRNDNNESEPVVIARVRISGDDIPESDRIPANLLLTDTQVNAKVRCGNHRMGYSIFYGVWEFFYEKVAFFF